MSHLRATGYAEGRRRSRQTGQVYPGARSPRACAALPGGRHGGIPHDQKGERYERTAVISGKRLPVTDHLFWAGYTGAFLPSTVAPCAFTPAGSLVGVQIVGAQCGDLTCLAFARLLEREFQVRAAARLRLAGDVLRVKRMFTILNFPAH